MTRAGGSHFGIRNGLVISGSGLVYYAAAQFGFLFAFHPRQVTAVWPPTGIAFTAYLLFGYRVWPGIYVGALLANFANHEPLVTAATIACGNTLAGIVGLFLLRRLGEFDCSLERLKDVLGLVLVGAGMASVVSATNGVVNLAAAGIVTWSAFWPTWWVWWVGDTLGVILFTPLLYCWIRQPRLDWTRWRAAELAALFVGLAAVGQAAFSETIFPATALFRFRYAVFPFVIWAALRFTQREAATAAVLIAGIALWGTVNDPGPLASGPLEERLILLGLFLAVASCTALVLGAVTAERRRAQQALQEANERLRNDRGRQEEMEARLRASETRFRATFEQAAVGLAQVSLQGRFMLVNERLCQIVGYSREELTQKSVADITHPDDLSAQWSRSDAVRASKIDSYVMEKRYFHKDGSVVWVNLTVSLVRGAEVSRDYFVSVIEDITLRKRIEQELQRLASVVENSADFIGISDTSGSPVFVNRAGQALVGAEGLAECLQTPVVEYFAPEERPFVRDVLLPAVYSSGAWRGELRFRHFRTGAGIPVICDAFRIDDPHTGKPINLATVTRDITERKKAEEQLRQAEQRFRRVFESSPSGMIMVSQNGLISLVNAQAEKLFDYPREELLGQPIEVLLPERYRAGHAGLRRDFMAAPATRVMGAGRDLFGRRRDGTEVPIEIGLSSMSTAEGEFTLAAISDITERKRAESALRESERQTRLMADAMPQIVWTARPDGYLDSYNRRWYEFTGFSENQGGDESWTPILHPDDVQLCLNTWYSAVASGQPYEIQYRFWDRKRNGWRWHLGRALPIHDEQGRITKWVGTCTDIDEHKRLSEQLEHRVEQRTQDLLQSLSEKETLMKEVHHRVKNNLQVICSLLALQMEAAPLGSLSREPLQNAYDRVQSMALIHEKLYQSATLSDVDFGAYIESLATQLFHTYCVDARQIRLELSVEPIRLGIDQAIPCGLILNELVSNSLKHAFQDGRQGMIRIAFGRSGDRMALCVADNGVGLPEALQFDTTNSLGLQVVRTLVRQLNADIQIARDRGTRITIRWQLAPNHG